MYQKYLFLAWVVLVFWKENQISAYWIGVFTLKTVHIALDRGIHT